MRAIAFMVVLSLVLLSTAALADEFGPRMARTDVSDRSVADVPVSEGTKFELPGLINYQGVLTDEFGVALDGVFSIEFAIYPTSVGGMPIWTETQPGVQVDHGLFNVLLGSVNPLSQAVFDDPNRWLAVKVAGDPWLDIRHRFTAVGYAFRAAEADTAQYARTSASDGDWTILGNNIYSAVPGNVGIGTTNPVYDLDVHHTSGISWVRAKSGDSYAGLIIDRGDDTNNGYVIYQTGGISRWFLGQIGAGSANTDFAISTSYNPADGKFYLTQAGNLGIGTTSPDTKLEVHGSGGPEVKISGASGSETPSLIFERPGSGFYDWRLRDQAGHLYFARSPDDGATWEDKVFFGGASIYNGRVGIGTTSPSSELDVNGTTTTEILTITGGSDLAEPFAMSDEETILDGALVVIDDENPGKLKMSDRQYDHRVAGVVSGAGGINPGITLSQPGAVDDGRNVALSGRAYALADASNGPIQPGDLLTTSETPGHAMKATDRERSHGAIIGKAMSSLEQGEGLVLVLINLQ